MSNEFVSLIEESEHERRFSRVQNLQENREINPPKDPFKQEWLGILPEGQYGEVSLVSGKSEFITKFKEALEKGNYDNFQKALPLSDYSGIYRIKANDAKTDKDKLVVKNYSHENVAFLQGKLSEFLSKIESSGIHEEYKKEYKLKIESEMRHLDLSRLLATPDFTVKQKTPNEWGKFIDFKSTQEAGTVVLPYENLARELLAKSRDAKSKPAKTIKEALDFWSLSDSEKDIISYDSITSETKLLSNEQTVNLMGIIFKRYGLDNWKVVSDPAVTAINDSAREREMQIPVTRQFDSGDIIFIAGHETDHSLSVENGDRQEFGLLWEALYEYIETEEGKAAANELILGLSHTDPRQVKLYGRYLAVGMALKAKYEKEQIVPKHSIQEIYDELVELGVTKLDSKDIIWRIMRGTSLKHQGVELELLVENEIMKIPSAECFVKDAVYFEGQKEAFEWIRERMPVKAGHRIEVTTGASEFSDKTLARVGLKTQELNGGKALKLTYNQAKKQYPELIKQGRLTLLTINNLLSAGKIRLDMIEEGSFWEQNLRFGSKNGLFDLQGMLIPRDY